VLKTRLNLKKEKMKMPQTRIRVKQEIETLINEKALLFVEYVNMKTTRTHTLTKFRVNIGAK